MLTRPGSTPGSGWMRGVSDRLASAPVDPQSPPRRFWAGYIAFMALVFVILPIVQRRAMPPYSMRNARSYESAVRWAGLPLFAIGPAPVAIVAIGGRPRGVVAIGGIALGRCLRSEAVRGSPQARTGPGRPFAIAASAGNYRQ